MTYNITEFLNKINDKTANIGIIGMGYVGLPLALLFADKGFKVTGFDIDKTRVKTLNQGISPLCHISSDSISKHTESGYFKAVEDFSISKKMDALLICVPTPLTQHREPDLSYVEDTIGSMIPYLHKGQLLVLESTTYPGTTTDILTPLLEKTGLKIDEELFIAYSPEREDPGNKNYGTRNIPKVVGANTDKSRKIAVALYEKVVDKIVPVSSTSFAEAVKITENTFRAVNIALVNELKMIFTEMDIDIWEVIDAAATKPFGYMPFYPGPGLGGHCIPIDPFYLTWKAREYEIPTRFIELAGEVNSSMPNYVIQRTIKALNDHAEKSVKGSKILILGIAYKKNIDDMRESPSMVLIEKLEDLGADISYYDNYIPEIPNLREHPNLTGRKSIKWDLEKIERDYDLVMIVTDHDGVDYKALAKSAKLIIDTRNIVPHADNVIPA